MYKIIHFEPNCESVWGITVNLQNHWKKWTVINVEPGEQAAKKGVIVGDRIMAFDYVNIDDTNSNEVAENLKKGVACKITVERRKLRMELDTLKRKSKKHRPIKGDVIDEALAKVINKNSLNLNMKKIKGKKGQYTITGDPKKYAIKTVQDKVLIRIGGGWEDIVVYALRRSKHEQDRIALLAEGDNHRRKQEKNKKEKSNDLHYISLPLSNNHTKMRIKYRSAKTLPNQYGNKNLRRSWQVIVDGVLRVRHQHGLDGTVVGYLEKDQIITGYICKDNNGVEWVRHSFPKSGLPWYNGQGFTMVKRSGDTFLKLLPTSRASV